MGLKVVELFAGVGGFRLGLERADKQYFDTVWFNQWEPGKTVQHAHAAYCAHFANDGAPALSNHDIFDVTQNNMGDVPEHDLLVGGFPCQDYSVATTLDKSGGLDGKKGRLWWPIHDIIKAKQPSMVLLENVNTLLTKPSKQRGRSFGVILSCLKEAGYTVEWRVINAAEVGFVQRRRRVFIFAARNGTDLAKRMANAQSLASDSFFGSCFPGTLVGKERAIDVTADAQEASKHFTAQFESAGLMTPDSCRSQRVVPLPVNPTPILDILEKDGVDEHYFLDDEKWAAWETIKGAKSITRTVNEGTPEEFTYEFKEGSMSPIDEWHKPGRTILTGEGGKGPNRSTHVVIDPKTNRRRVLTPLECERLNGFEDNWTEMIPRRWRYFTMGNALVVDLVERMGQEIQWWMDPEGMVKTTKLTKAQRNALASLVEPKGEAPRVSKKQTEKLLEVGAILVDADAEALPTVTARGHLLIQND